MKSYKNVEMMAKNAPSGSYAAGCPQYQAGTGCEYGSGRAGDSNNSCKYCECTR